ncbi:MAG TPA: prolyl oligopeptidase family serine peptidase [Gemmatimonadales bacterium]|nr:prolyl oligopeptidase family serine peptidase [Gemmatimonadales bacterium]
MSRRLAATLVVTLFTAASPIAAQQFDLSVDNIMRGPELVGRAPQGLRGGFGGGGFSWSPDSRFVWFRWQQPGVDTSLVVYRVSVTGGAPERFEKANPDTILAGPAEWSPDRSRAVYQIRGDLVLWTPRGTRKLTDTPVPESGARWSADGRAVFFQRDGNLFSLNVETAQLRQLTDIRRGAAPREEREPEGQRKVNRDHTRELFEFIRSGRYKEQPWNQQRADDDTTRPKPFYPGEGKNVGNLQATADGRFVAFTVTEQPRDAKRVTMPVWITDDGYVGTYTGRTYVGDQRAQSRAAVLEVATGKVTFVADSVGQGDRSVEVVDVSPTSTHALVRVETHDDEYRYWVVVDLPGLATRVVAQDRDSAWISFPGPQIPTRGGFLKDGESVWFGSERSGWAHLYTVPAAGGAATAVTSGEWEVLDADLSPDGGTWYLTANKESFAEVHLYTVSVRGGAITRLTDPVGRQEATASPDGRWLALSHSAANDPPELYLQENRTGRPMRQVTESTTEEFRRGPWIKPEIVMIPARDGVGVPARIYRPTGNVPPEGRRPAVIFVHGAGYAQNVHHWWSSYSREYMFHHLLAARGYTVLDIDYRGSAGHGRDWRTAIYRHMGGNDLTDQVDGARWLVATQGVDSARIGIYGGSYGGFMTLMAMFTAPGIFKAGAALRPVTDWAHYNDGYSSAILNDPQADTAAYRRSSPIFHAAGLKDALLICHGMVDDNVLFYDTVRLTQRLIELGKDNWEVAMYPAERHGFTEVSSWRDEYKRILKLFETNLRGGGVAAGN